MKNTWVQSGRFRKACKILRVWLIYPNLAFEDEELYCNVKPFDKVVVWNHVDVGIPILGYGVENTETGYWCQIHRFPSPIIIQQKGDIFCIVFSRMQMDILTLWVSATDADRHSDIMGFGEWYVVRD